MKMYKRSFIKSFGFNHSFLVLMLILVTGVISSCGSDKKPGKEKEINFKSSTAYFDSFTYTGKDDFYEENPLPGRDHFYNPILPGWYSDPSITSNGEDFFMVNSTFSYFPGVPLFHSKDLVNWEQIGHVLDRPSQLKLIGQKVSEGIFAPAISYNPHNQTYYMITTNIGGGNFFVKTKDPFGSWSDPVWLPEVGGIDPSLFFDDDGRAYIVNNDEPDGGSQYEGHRAIQIQELDVEKEEIIPGTKKMLVNGGVNLEEKPIWIEGPHVYKVDGQYFLMCAEGGTSVNHREVIFRSNSVTGPYEAAESNPILTQKHLDPNRPDPITCAGHADLIQNANGDWWSVFLACRPLNNEFENLGRETFLLPVKWEEKGFPSITQDDEVIPMVVQMPGVQRKDKVTFGNFSQKTEFSEAKLQHEWMTLRGTADDLYSLTDNPGYLALECADVLSTELEVPAFVSRRMQHHKFESETAMIFEPSTEEEAAGMLLFKDETHQYAFLIGRSGNDKVITVEKISESGPEVLETVKIREGQEEIRMKVTSSGLEYSFHYALEGDTEWLPVTTGVDARYLSTANSYGFTGTNIGLYATKKKEETGGKSKIASNN